MAYKSQKIKFGVMMFRKSCEKSTILLIILFIFLNWASHEGFKTTEHIISIGTRHDIALAPTNKQSENICLKYFFFSHN